MHRFLRRVRFLFRRDRFERELQEEMQLHLDMKVRERVDDGLTPESARRAARLQFGNVDRARETSRETWAFGLLESLVRDQRYAARILARSPAFTVVAVLTLGLAI